MVGLGSTLVDLMRDVALRYGTIDTQTAHAMVGELAGTRVLEGVHGGAPCDSDSLAEAISRLSQFGIANPGRIAGMDINPLPVWLRGPGVPGAGCLDRPCCRKAVDVHRASQLGAAQMDRSRDPRRIRLPYIRVPDIEFRRPPRR